MMKKAQMDQKTGINYMATAQPNFKKDNIRA